MSSSRVPFSPCLALIAAAITPLAAAAAGEAAPPGSRAEPSALTHLEADPALEPFFREAFERLRPALSRCVSVRLFDSTQREFIPMGDASKVDDQVEVKLAFRPDFKGTRLETAATVKAYLSEGICVAQVMEGISLPEAAGKAALADGGTVRAILRYRYRPTDGQRASVRQASAKALAEVCAVVTGAGRQGAGTTEVWERAISRAAAAGGEDAAPVVTSLRSILETTRTPLMRPENRMAILVAMFRQLKQQEEAQVACPDVDVWWETRAGKSGPK